MTWTWRRDLPVAIAVAGMTLALYAGTLQPDFGGPEDTPKFQFLGYVLGTAHPPGYPLYVLLTHLFVQLPIGSVAYRANLFSAVMASLGCGVAYWIARELGARWWASAGAALALAAGASFWRSAVFAEVYSLAALLVAGVIALLLAWANRGGNWRLLGAVAVFAAGLGNHLTIVGIVPAAVLYVIFRVLRNRAVLTLRVVAAAALICVAGVAQYGFILLRTQQGGTYLESRAESLRDLVGVVRADRFEAQRFAFTFAEVLQTNVPAIARVLATELMPLGLACFAVGVVVAVMRRSPGGGLVLGGAAGMLAMIVNMAGDLQGFVTPVVVLLWPVAALGIDTVAAGLARRLGARTALAAATLVAIALPVAGVVTNYRDADQSRQTTTAAFFRDTYTHLPSHAVVVAENYFYDMAHEYFTATGDAGTDRGVTKIGYTAQAVRRTAAVGGRVFAFAGAASTLAAEGLWFERTTLAAEPLEAWLRRLPRDTVLVGAAAFAAVPFDPTLVGHAGARGAGRATPFETFILVVGREGAAWKRDENRAALQFDDLSANARVRELGAPVEGLADATGAMVVVGGHPIAAVPAGLVLAAFMPDGASPQTLEFAAGDVTRVGVPGGAIYELKGESPCVRLTSAEWQEVGALLSTGAAVGTLAEIGNAAVEIEIQGKGVLGEAGHLLGDGETSVVRRRDAQATTLEWQMSRSGERRPLFRLALTEPVRSARARLRPESSVAGATICSHRSWRPLAGVDAGGRGRVGADFESEGFYGAGWSAAERRADGVARHGASGATLLLPLDPARRYRARLAFAAGPSTGIEVFVNDVRAGTCRLESERLCEIVLPAPLPPALTTMRFESTVGSPARWFTFFGAWFEPVSAQYP